MGHSPSYEELRQRVLELEQEHRKRLQAEEESEKRQRYLEGVLQNAPDAVVTLDSSHRVVEWNLGAQRMFGYSPEEAQGRDLDELITRFEEAREARDYTQHVLAGNSVEALESVRYTKDGSPVHVLVSGSPIIRENRLSGVIAIYTDVTERKRMEQALQASERKYRAIFENTGTATAIVEEDTTISMVNSELENLSGYTREEIEGRMPFTRFIACERDREKMLAYHRMRRQDRSGAPEKYEAAFHNKAGNLRNVIVTVDIIPETRQSIVSFLDITHYKELQEAYKQERDHLDHILEYSPDAIAITNQRGELIRFNRIAAELSGYTSEEIQGKPPSDFYADKKEMERMFETLRSLEEVRNHEIDFLRKDGTRVPCSVSISLLRSGESEVIGSVSIIRDLREWKEMLQTIREQEEKFKGIASSALDGVIMMDDQGRISYWNPAAE
ncbi:MAG: PAS domain S-box protein, partial [Desulfohalobiaceae bacterium]|nr:PAS domain S-box protein [Desulfohalobiaceae bacterium]